MAIRVFLLDDHEIVRRGLHELLESAGDLEVVGEAATGPEALARIPLSNPDVAILDVRLGEEGGMDGIEVCREARSARPGLSCLMLTSHADDEALLAAIMAGASGYILKQIRGSDMIEAIRKVARGESLIDRSLHQRVLSRLKAGAAQDERMAALSGQERKILDRIADGKTNREIARDLFLAEKTVKNYVSNLLAKMGMSSRTEAAVYVARHPIRPVEHDRS